jgi:DNA-binding GntR family transcriptional regulator
VAQRAALNITRRDIASALEIADAMAETDATSSALSILNREFHFLFYARCGVPSLVELIDWLWRSYPWDILLVLSDRAANAADEHRAMARAVAGCDLAAIEETFTTNIVRSYLAIARHLGESDPCDPYPVEG